MWANSLGASKLATACLLGLLAMSCSGNILTELSNETSDEALYEEAMKQLDEKDYAAAVAACEDMSATATADRDVAFICASAYSGRCGLDFLALIAAIDGYTLGTPDLMLFLLQMNDGATATHVSDCVASTTLLQSIGAASARTDNENMLMVFNNLQTMGVLANFLADTDNDDAVDGGYDTCADVDATNGQYLAEAFWEMEASAGSTGSTDIAALGTVITAACTALDVGDATADFCDAADADSFTVDHLRGARGLFRENTDDFGLAAEACGNAVACAAACP